MKKPFPYLLLADDDPDDQETFLEAFSRLNVHAAVRTVNDGKELFEFLDGRPPDELPVMILLDYKMPLVTAPEILERLSNHPLYAAIVKVVWSSSERSKDMQDCLRLGATAYFKKPSTAKELDEIIRQIDAILAQQAVLYKAGVDRSST